MKTKILLIITILVMLFSFIIPITSKAAEPYPDIFGKIELTGATGLRGETVTVSIKTKADVTVKDFLMVLLYNKDNFEYVSYETGNIAAMIAGNDRQGKNDPERPDGFAISCGNAYDMTIPAGTTIANVTFRIKDTATTDNITLKEENTSEKRSFSTATITVKIPATGITLDKQELSLNMGNKKSDTLTATVTPDDTQDKVTWKSNNPSVITLEENPSNDRSVKVVAVGKGTATVSATVNGKEVSCNVTVSSAPLTSLTLSEPPTEVIKGKEFTFTVTPNEGAEISQNGLVWETSSSETATVDSNGTVHPLKAGEVTITVKAKDNETIKDSKTFTVKEIALDSIDIDSEDFELFKGDTKQLNILYNPENTTDDISNVEWTSDNSDIVSVDKNGLVTAKAVGEATITAKVAGKETSVKVTVPEVLIDDIEVKVEKQTLKIGETTQMVVKTIPEKVTEDVKIIYSAEDPSIVSVNQYGVVTANKPGKAKIIATVNGKYEGSITFEVLDEVYEEEAKPSTDNTNPVGGTNPAGGEPAAAPAGISTILPNTGDIAIGVFVVLMVISLGGIVFMVVRNKKMKK